MANGLPPAEFFPEFHVRSFQHLVASVPLESFVKLLLVGRWVLVRFAVVNARHKLSLKKNDSIRFG